MNKARVLLAVILIMAAAGGAMATKARSFLGYISNNGVYSAVYVPFDCPDTGPGCIYTSWNSQTFQVYTLSGLKFTPVKP
jgi:hypothetical protein